MRDLVEFLLARIAEDEALWQMAGGADMAVVVKGQQAVPPTDFARRMLADCEAKRLIAMDAAIVRATNPKAKDLAAGLVSTGMAKGYELALAALALPYADHPDFDPAWRELLDNPA